MGNKLSSHVQLLEQLTSQAIDMHCHGVGRFDFTEISALDLDEIESLLQQRKQRCILTVYLNKHFFSDFLNLLNVFSQGKQAGKYSYIVGFGVEGPLLASLGGTPTDTAWVPTKRHWEDLAACGAKGLVYVIFSPDAELPPTFNENDEDNTPVCTAWIAETLLSGGVLPTPGHFSKKNPARSAQLLQEVFNKVAEWGVGPTITDHLFNDMPHNFQHAWRTPEEKLRRNIEIKSLKLETWNLDNLEDMLGPVPATMIRNARRGLVKICQNFDGEHVDLAIIKKVIELVGAENILMMTDSIESKVLAGRALHTEAESTLLYQDDGIVAAGSQDTAHQIMNMISMGLTQEQIQLITQIVPLKILQQQSQYCHEKKS